MRLSIDNRIDIINGSSLAATIGAGACVLVFEWGIINFYKIFENML
ncbi:MULTISPECIES: hypothetical protein [Clostridium]|uniref:Uncharacterized protein n=1 Tax=Clostridium sartagoforme AAU1 TaxID=1202534 RepID=R9CAY0_9CLOT|nr:MULTISPECIES: hypothetical protein [Clostridium]EOR26467.1 hypothetical protein A500_07826 [Clostridium sartagoforme AAU1]